jgi:hypothetical protein
MAGVCGRWFRGLTDGSSGVPDGKAFRRAQLEAAPYERCLIRTRAETFRMASAFMPWNLLTNLVHAGH